MRLEGQDERRCAAPCCLRHCHPEERNVPEVDTVEVADRNHSALHGRRGSRDIEGNQRLESGACGHMLSVAAGVTGRTLHIRLVAVNGQEVRRTISAVAVSPAFARNACTAAASGMALAPNSAAWIPPVTSTTSIDAATAPRTSVSIPS